MKRIDHDKQDVFSIVSTVQTVHLISAIVFVAIGGAMILVDDIQRFFVDHPVRELGYGVLAIGLGVLTWRRGAMVDRREHSVTRWWGLGCYPYYYTTRPFVAEHVHLGKAIDCAGELPETNYPLSIVGEGRWMVLAKGHSIAPTAAIAQSLALFLEVDFQDSTQEDLAGVGSCG